MGGASFDGVLQADFLQVDGTLVMAPRAEDKANRSLLEEAEKLGIEMGPHRRRRDPETLGAHSQLQAGCEF